MPSPPPPPVYGKVPRAELWTAERPFLYTLVVSTHRVGLDGQVDEGAAPLQCESSRVGFRKVGAVGPPGPSPERVRFAAF